MLQALQTVQLILENVPRHLLRIWVSDDVFPSFDNLSLHVESSITDLLV
jgi:hypothetical protein